MHKIEQDIKKELKNVEEIGLNQGNLDAVGKMVDILKDIKEIREMEGGEMRDYRYGREDYTYNEGRGGYGARMRDGRGRYMEGNHNESGNYGRGGNFINMDPRMWDRLERIMDGADMYQYGRDRYRGGDSEERMVDGLEKLMYAVCTFVESMMDFAETPQEKEIIRKHVQKMAKM
jgi:hypothetical protein